MNCSTSTSCNLHAVVLSAHFSRRHSVGALAMWVSTPTAVCMATSWRRAWWSFKSSQPSAKAYTRWRSISTTSCVISKGLRGSAMQRAAASIKPSLRSAAPSSMIAASLVMLAPSKRPCTMRRPSRPNSILLVCISSVQLGIGSPVLLLASDTNDNVPHGQAAYLFR